MEGETVTEVVLILSDLDKKNYRDFAFKKLTEYLKNYFSAWIESILDSSLHRLFNSDDIYVGVSEICAKYFKSTIEVNYADKHGPAQLC